VVGVLGRDVANRLSEPYHDWQARRRTRRYLSLEPPPERCLNIGCGYHPLDGWTNLDKARGPQVDVVWDIRRGLPFASGTCSAILAEHVIEHLSRADGERLLTECFRILRLGGVLRVSTPDAERFLRAYAGDRSFLWSSDFPEPVETAIDRVNAMMREGGQHLWSYDTELLSLLLRRAGFTDVQKKAFGESAHPRMKAIDAPSRQFESLYVEASRGA
jgi:predicted SAM-dependent methyltransferase